MRRALRIACWLPFAVVMTVLWAPLPRVGISHELDCGWQGLLLLDHEQGARAGVDQVFTYGPLGWLTAETMFDPTGLPAHWLWKLLYGGVLTAALASLAGQLPTRPWRLGWLAFALAAALWLAPGASFVAITALGLFLLRLPTASRAAPVATAAALAALACAALVKFTFALQALATIGIAAATLAAARRRRGAAALLGGASIALLGAWLLAGQSLADLSAWWRGAVEIARGYNESMGIDGGAPAIAWAAALTLGNALLAWLLHRQLAIEAAAEATASDEVRSAPTRRWQQAGSIALVAVGLATAWKAGFVRQDNGHVVMFYGYAIALPFVLIAVSGVRRPPRMAAALAAATVGCALAVQHATMSTFAGFHPGEMLQTRWLAATQPRAALEWLAMVVQQQREPGPLPELRRRVGESPIDLVGNRQGLALASGFHFHHRPVFQSYSAYTPYLQRLNGVFFRGDKAPQYALAQVWTLGGRLPLCEDSQAWRALLDDYRPIAAENDVALLQRRLRRSPPTPPATPTRRQAEWNDWVELPPDGEWHALSLRFDVTLYGRAIALLLRPSPVLLDLRIAGEPAPRTFAIAAGLAELPFVVDPPLAGTRELLAAWRGDAVPRATAFRVRPAPGAESQYRRRGIDFAIESFAPPGDSLDADERRELDAAIAALSR